MNNQESWQGNEKLHGQHITHPEVPTGFKSFLTRVWHTPSSTTSMNSAASTQSPLSCSWLSGSAGSVSSQCGVRRLSVTLVRTPLVTTWPVGANTSCTTKDMGGGWRSWWGASKRGWGPVVGVAEGLHGLILGAGCAQEGWGCVMNHESSSDLDGH